MLKRSGDVTRIRSIRRRLLRVAAMVAVVLAGVGASPAASSAGARAGAPLAAGKLSDLIAASHTISVNRDGVTWRLEFQVSWIPTQTIVTVVLLRSANHATEVHFWQVADLPARAVMFGRAGSWTVAPRAGAISPLLRAFRLSFTPSAHRAASNCTRGSETSYTGTLRGSVRLASGIPAVGLLGKMRTSIGRSHATIDHSCLVTKPPCATTSVNWFESSGGLPFRQDAEGNTHNGRDTIQLNLTHNLARPAHATRTDSLLAAEPAVTSHGQTLIVTTRSGTAISGRAKVRKTSRLGTFRLACWRRGVRHTQVDTSWGASLSSTPLTAKTRLTGTLSTPKTTGTANISQIVIK